MACVNSVPPANRRVARATDLSFGDELSLARAIVPLATFLDSIGAERLCVKDAASTLGCRVLAETRQELPVPCAGGFNSRGGSVVHTRGPSGRSAIGAPMQTAIDQGIRELPLQAHELESVLLELMTACATVAQGLALSDESAQSLFEALDASHRRVIGLRRAGRSERCCWPRRHTGGLSLIHI